MPFSKGKLLSKPMGRRQSFSGQRDPSQPDTVIGSKKAGVPISDFYPYQEISRKPCVVIDQIGLLWRE